MNCRQTGRIVHKIILIRIHSSFCVLNFKLFAPRKSLSRSAVSGEQFSWSKY